MPIYTQENHNEKDWELVNNEAFSVVAHFGSGDIEICTATRRNQYDDEILLFQSDVVLLPDDAVIGKPAHSPIVLRFDDVKAIDALIGQLTKLKDSMPKTRVIH